MGRRLMAALIVSAMLPWGSLSFAEEPMGLPYDEDFEDGTADGWISDSGTWSIEEDGGTLVYKTLASESIARSVCGDFQWADYTASVNFKINAWGSQDWQTAGLLMRYRNANNYYLFIYNKPGELQISKKTNGSITNLASKAVEISMDQWYTLTAVVDHAYLKLYLNGTEELAAVDLSLDTGKAGLISAFGDISYDVFTARAAPAPGDTQPPTVPSNLTASENTPGLVDLSWDPSQDNDLVAGYRVFRDGEELTVVSQTTCKDASTAPATTYAYAVQAIDAYGNLSDISTPAAFTTSPVTNSTSFNSDLIGVHPRLLITEEMQEELERRKTDPDYGDMYTNLLTLSNNSPQTVNWFASNAGTDFNWEYVSWRLPTLAMAYKVTGEEAYREKIRNYVLDLIQRPEWCGEEGGSMGNACGLIGVGYAYDWAHDAFTPQERSQIANKLKVQAKKLYTQFSTNLSGSLGYWKSDYQNNHRQFRIEGLLVGVSAILGDLNDSEIATMYTFAEQELQTLLEQLAPDGSQHEGPQYMSYGNEHVIRAVALYESVTGIGLWNETLRNIGTFKQYLYGPGLTRLAPYGDDSNTLYYFNHYLFKIASVYRDAQLQSMAEKAYAVSSGSFTWPAWTFLFYDDTLEAEDTYLPEWKYFDDLEYVNMRTGWEADDISVSFKSGPPGGDTLNAWRDHVSPNGTYVNVAHDRPEAGNFYIEFGGKRWGSFPPYDKVDRQTRDHNTLLIDGKGQHGERTDAWFQPFANMRDEARISEFFGSPDYSLATGDISKAYDNMSRMDRDILLVDGRYVVVHDTLESSAGTRSFQFLFHNNGTWTGSLEDGYVITQDTDSMALYMLETEGMTATLGAANKSSMGTTLKVVPSSAVEKTGFLGVFFPQLNGETLPAKPQAVTDEEGTKLTVSREGDVTDIIAFSSNPAGTGTLSTEKALAFAQSLTYTVRQNETDTAMAIRADYLSLANLRMDFSQAVNVRYQKEDDGFTLWAGLPLDSEAEAVQAVLSGLIPGASYTLEGSDGIIQSLVAGSDGRLTLTLPAAQENYNVKVTGQTGNDNQAPTMPGGLCASSDADTRISLKWEPSGDNIGVVGYEVSRDGSLIGLTPATAYADSGLSALTAYAYEVRAYDLAGNFSQPAGITASTLAPDTTAPSVPSELTGFQSARGIELSWSPSTDDRLLAGYRVYKDGIFIADVTKAAYTDTDTQPVTEYSYTVTARDESGNESPASVPFVILTSNTMYSTDFEGEIPEWSVPAGSWSLVQEDGNQVYKPSTTYDNNAVTGSLDWTDYRVQTKIKVNSFVSTNSPEVGIRVREADTSNFYFLGYKGGSLTISRCVNGRRGATAYKAFTFVPGQWYVFEAVVKGNRLELYVDGNLELTWTDGSLTEGKAGLYSRFGDVRFDDFSVYGE